MKKTIIAAVAIATIAASGSAMANESMMMSNDSMMMADSAMMAEEGVMVGGAMMIESRDIVDNAVLANNVTTVVAAVKAAGLVDTLKSEGPFTVFAPNNTAFEKLPAGTVETLLKAENKAMLVDILTYHVVAGSYKSSDLTNGLMLTTVEGKKLKFTKVNGKLMINGAAMVETADVISKNGVTHVIDTVLLPPKEEAMEGVMVGGAMMIESRDIVDNAVLANNVTTVVAAVKAAGLVDTLKSEGPFTVFAPNNTAFEKLPAGTVETLLKAENKAMLVDILTYHVVAGSYKSSDLTNGLMLTTVEGKKLKFTKVNGKLMINGAAMVETADVISKNGVTHVIDTVLLPPKEESMMKKIMRGTVSSIAAQYGYNWKRDRASLAAQLGIQNYRGTLSQNLKIRAYLLQMDTMMVQK